MAGIGKLNVAAAAPAAVPAINARRVTFRDIAFLLGCFFDGTAAGLDRPYERSGPLCVGACLCRPLVPLSGEPIIGQGIPRCKARPFARPQRGVTCFTSWRRGVPERPHAAVISAVRSAAADRTV